MQGEQGQQTKTNKNTSKQTGGEKEKQGNQTEEEGREGERSSGPRAKILLAALLLFFVLVITIPSFHTFIGI